MTNKRKKERRKKSRHLKKINTNKVHVLETKMDFINSCLFLLNSFKPLLIGVFLGVSTIFVLSSVLAQNFMYYTMSVAQGMEFIANTKNEELLKDTSDFSNLTVDLNTSTLDDIIQLKQIGDKAPNFANGNWWDDDSDPSTDYNWNYRRCFEVGNNGAFISDYQIYLDVDTLSYISSGQMNINGDDIRFLDENNNNLDYYILDEINTNSTKIWVKLKNLASNYTSKICMYWGNPSASPKSNRLDTFSYPSAKANYYVLHDYATSQELTIGSYKDNNVVTSGINTQTIDEFKISNNLTINAQSVGINNDKPIQANWKGDGTGSIVPASAGGVKFVYRVSRSTNVFSVASPFCDSTLSFRGDRNGINDYALSGAPTSLNKGQSIKYTTTNSNSDGLPNNAVVLIESTNNCPILVTHINTANGDHFTLFPASKEWIGTGTGRLEFAAFENATSVTVYRSTGSSNTYNLNRGDSVAINDTGSQGSDPAHYVVANKDIGVNSQNDGDGAESTTFLPVDELSTKFIIPEDAQYIAVASLPNQTITGEVYNNGAQCGVGAPNLVQTNTSTSLTIPTKLYFGSTSNGTFIPSGACLLLSSPGHVIVEKSNFQDEFNIWGEKQNRPYLNNLPISYLNTSSGSWSLGQPSPNTWQNRQVFTVNNTSSSTLTEVPINLKLQNYNPSSIFGSTQNDGGDVRVGGLIGNGTDNYPYSIDRYNASSGYGNLWIQIPSIPANNSVSFAVYFNHTPSTVTTTSNPINVFSYSTLKENYFFVDSRGVSTNSLYVWGIENGGTVSYFSNNFSTSQGVEINFNVNTLIPSNNYTYGNKISSYGPITGDSMVDATDVIAPEAYLGTEFLTYAYRQNDVFNVLSPDLNATVSVQYENGGNWVTNQTLTANAGIPIKFTTNIVSSVGVRVISNVPILVTYRADQYDSKVLIPSSFGYVESTDRYEIYGVGSTNGYIIASQDNTTITYYLSDGTTNTVSLNEGGVATISGIGQGTGYGIKAVSNKPIGGMSAADNDGVESVVFLPKKEFNTTYLYTQESQYIIALSDSDQLQCTLYDINNNVLSTQTTTNNGVNYPNLLYFGNSASNVPVYNKGVRLDCNKPFYSYYEKINNDNSISDETNVLTYNQGRIGLQNPPTIQSIRSTGIFNESLYFQTGVIQYTIDLNSVPNSQTTVWKTFQWLQNLPLNTNIVVEVATNNANPCSNIGVSYQTITNNSINNLSVPNGTCFYLQITLNTNDRQYTPVLDDLFVQYNYLNPIPSSSNIIINLNHNTTSVIENILEVKSNNPNLAGKNSYLVYKGGVNANNFSNFNMDLYDTNSLLSYNQFTSVPAYGDTGLNNASQSNNIGIEINYQSINTTPSTMYFTYVIKVGNPTIYVTHDFTINFN